MPLIQWIMQNLQGNFVQGSATLRGNSTVTAVAWVAHEAQAELHAYSTVFANGTVIPASFIEGSAFLQGHSSVTATGNVNYQGNADLQGKSRVVAAPNVIPGPKPQPHIDDRYSLGVTFGIPGYTQKRKRKQIKIKFTFAGNTYEHDEELGDEVSVFLKSVIPKQLKKAGKGPSVMIETIKAGNGQNYNLQEQG